MPDLNRRKFFTKAAQFVAGCALAMRISASTIKVKEIAKESITQKDWLFNPRDYLGDVKWETVDVLGKWKLKDA